MFSSLHENGGEHRGVAGEGAMGGTKWTPKKCKTLLSHKLLSGRSPKGFAYLTLSLSIYRDREGATRRTERMEGYGERPKESYGRGEGKEREEKGDAQKSRR